MALRRIIEPHPHPGHRLVERRLCETCQFNDVELVVNLKAAKPLGLTVPASLLSGAGVIA